MSFYEDLGVQHNATAEEIREKYRVLVRLFHPDQFADPVLKAAAEGQMRRINEIQAVLTDAERRSEYDAALLRGRSEPAIIIQALRPERPVRRIPWASMAWGAAAMACASAIVWVSGLETPVAAVHAELKSLSASNDDLRAKARAATTERDHALSELARLRSESTQSQPAAASEPFASTSLPRALRSSEPSRARSRFAGVWSYGRATGADDQRNGQIYIEVRITETDRHLSGQYRSTLVNFEFSGQAKGNTAQLALVRDNGARGEVQLRLISQREMQLSWTAAGRASRSLTSGTALLIKNQ